MGVVDARKFPGFLTSVLTLSFRSHRLLFSHASELKGEHTPDRKFASTGYEAHNHQVMGQTRSPLNHSGGLGSVVRAKLGCEHEQPIYSNREGTSQNHSTVKIRYSNFYILCLGLQALFSIFGNLQRTSTCFPGSQYSF